ncbi:TRAP transporter large permease subunit [Paracoccaceae bacterium]|nr:TRAP transporter large permease subunit [Paracoccaceae bacterium]
MELFFLAVLFLTMAFALGSGYPVAFSLPGAAIISIAAAALFGYLIESDSAAYFHSGSPYQWLSAGVTNLRFVYWDVERDTLIAIPLFIFMGIMLQKSKIAEDLLVTMANLFGPVPGGLGISVVFVGALLAATTGIVGATVVAMGLISLPVMLRNKYSPALATGTIAASGTLGQIIPPSIVLIILADQLGSAADQASSIRKSLHKEATGDLSMPSVMDVTSTSAGEMFLGAFVPGVVLVLLYMIFILILALFFPRLAPSVPYNGRMDSAFWFRVGFILIPPLTLIVLVLGSIITGIATVNQAGAIGAAGALVMAGYRLNPRQDYSAYLPAIILLVSILIMAFALANFDMNILLIQDGRDLTGIIVGLVGATLFIVSLVWSCLRLYKIEGTLNDVMLETAKTTSLVFIILLGAAVLTAAFRAFGGEDLVREFLNSLPGGFWAKFIIVMAVIFVLGFFLDFIEIAVVVVPIVAPILLADPSANITAVWLGVMIGLNIQTSFLTPPFGFALFYLRGVAPAIVKTVQMYKGVVPFIMLQILALFIVGYYPALVNYLPNRTSFLSENSPPPKNPRLQYCIERYSANVLFSNDNFVQNAVVELGGTDMDVLPKKIKTKLTNAVGDANTAIASLKSAIEQEILIEKEAIAYRPILNKVRRLESRINIKKREIKELKKEQVLQKTLKNDDELKVIESEIKEIEKEIDEINQQKPANWDQVYKEFKSLMKEEQKQRNMYRRAGENSFKVVEELSLILASDQEILELKTEYELALQKNTELSKEERVKTFNEVSKKAGQVLGTSEFKSKLSKAIRELKKKNVKEEKVNKNLDAALKEIMELYNWVSISKGPLEISLKTYLDKTKGSLGIRAQDRFNKDLALYLASCNANHRDLSLSF